MMTSRKRPFFARLPKRTCPRLSELNRRIHRVISHALRSRCMKSRTGAGILLLGVFVLGAVTGVVSHSLYKSHVEAASAKPPGRGSQKIVDDLAVGLNLDSQ